MNVCPDGESSDDVVGGANDQDPLTNVQIANPGIGPPDQHE